jgi:ribosomal protein L21
VFNFCSEIFNGKTQKKMEITEVFSVDGEEVVVSEEIVQAAKIATESLRMKKNTETLCTPCLFFGKIRNIFSSFSVDSF